MTRVTVEPSNLGPEARGEHAHVDRIAVDVLGHMGCKWFPFGMVGVCPPWPPAACEQGHGSVFGAARDSNPGSGSAD
jgi:hypothetical protein